MIGIGGRGGALALLLSLGGPASAGAQEAAGGPPGPELRPGFEALRAPLESRIARHRGVVGLVLVDPATGEALSFRGGERFPSASVIKVPLLVEVFQRVEEGALSLDDPLIMLEGDRTGGSGVLRLFSAPHRLTVGDAATLMIALSDNTATNLLVDEVGARSVGVRMRSLGLGDTELWRKSFGDAADSFRPDSSAVYGFGMTSPMDLARLLAGIQRRQVVSEAASEAMLEMLREQFYRFGLPRHLPEGTPVAHKTGSISAARHDCGVVESPARTYVLCVMTSENEDRSWTDANEAEGLIADLSLLVYRELNEGGAGSP